MEGHQETHNSYGTCHCRSGSLQPHHAATAAALDLLSRRVGRLRAGMGTLLPPEYLQASAALSGAGDMGIDVVGFVDDKRLEGVSGFNG